MGSEIDFEHAYKYNHESQVGLTMNISKTCYSKGDWINGNLYLKTKPYMQEGILFNPIAYIIITELHHGEKSKSNNDYYEIKETPGNNKSEEEKNVLMYPLDLSAYNGVNLFQGINIPFQVKIPDNCYPSYIFDSDTYVRHFLTIDFTSIKAKKSEVIIIKNDQYFSLENNLFKTPIECNKEILKKGMISQWLFNMTIKLSLLFFLLIYFLDYFLPFLYFLFPKLVFHHCLFHYFFLLLFLFQYRFLFLHFFQFFVEHYFSNFYFVYHFYFFFFFF